MGLLMLLATVVLVAAAVGIRAALVEPFSQFVPIVAPGQLRAEEQGEAATQAARRNRELFGDAPVIYAVTSHGHGGPAVTDCNEAFLRALGYRREDMIGRSVAAFYTPGSAPDPSVLARGASATAERRLLAHDGHTIDAVLWLRPELDGFGAVVGAWAAFINVGGTEADRGRTTPSKECGRRGQPRKEFGFWQWLATMSASR